MIENIVSRAKKAAIKRFIGSDGIDKGIRLEDLRASDPRRIPRK